MKVCHLCGESYKDCVDFCFQDGEVLKAVGAAGDADVGADAPAMPGRVQGSQPPYPAPPITRPVVRTQRTESPAAEAVGDPAAEPVPAPNLAEDDTEAEVDPAAEVPAELGDDAEDDDDQITVPPSGVDTAPMIRPSAQVTPELTPRSDPANAASSTAATPARPPRAQRTPSPVPAPAAQSHPTPSPPPRAMTFDGEEEQPGSSLVMLGVAAAVLGMFFVLGAGVVVVSMSSGLFGPTDGVDAVGTVDRDPITVPDPPPAPPPVVPVGAPEVPDPVLEVPDPVTVEPVPERPVPAPVVPAPAVPAPPRPVPLNDGVSDATPKPAPPKPAPLAQVDVLFRSTPTAAMVYVDNVKIGPAPITAKLTAGKHTYELRKDGYETVSNIVDVKGEPITVGPFTLVSKAPPPAPVAPEPAPAPVAPEPAGEATEARRGAVLVFAKGFVGAELLMDGVVVGALPARIADVPEGEHTFVIKADGGDLTIVRKVEIEENSESTVLTLQ